MALRDDEPFVDAGDVIAVTARQAPHAIARPVGLYAKAALFLPVNHHVILVTLVIMATRRSAAACAHNTRDRRARSKST